MFVKVMNKVQRDEYKKKSEYEKNVKILTPGGTVYYLKKEQIDKFLDSAIDGLQITKYFWLCV